MAIKIEVLCGSVRDCIIAQEKGADRIELNNATQLGGLTPSIGTLLEAKNHVNIPIVVMIRPRPAGFCYDTWEFAQMQTDAKSLLEAGADGIVFGFLNADASVDIARTKVMVALAKHYGKEAIFHRAFDNVSDATQAIETLIDCGVDRILTAGLANHVMDGIQTLTTLQKQYGHAIQLLPGGGVDPSNLETILKETNINQLHGSFKEWVSDPLADLYANRNTHKENDYFQVDPEVLETVMTLAKNH